MISGVYKGVLLFELNSICCFTSQNKTTNYKRGKYVEFNLCTVPGLALNCYFEDLLT